MQKCPFIRNFDKISGPKRSIKITDHFTCTSAKVISCMHDLHSKVISCMHDLHL